MVRRKNTVSEKPVLVTGATGYVGGRVALRLLKAGYKVRATARSLTKLQARAWAGHSNLELVYSDALDLDSLTKAADGCWAAYYFIHSMDAESKDYALSDRIAAQNMVKAAQSARLERIIYLGGLSPDSPGISEHLGSREEVARILEAGPVPVTHFRAAMILGSGSTSFEMLRYLVERLPVMVTSRRVMAPSQPIAIRNVLVYLVRSLEVDETIGQTYDIGGPEILTYRDIIDIYSEEAGLKKRIVIPVSFMTPRMASWIIHLVTPIPSYIAMPLAEGIGSNMIVRDGHKVLSIIPQQLLTCKEAIHMALERIEQKVIKSSWMDAGVSKPPEWGHYNDAHYAGGDIRESWHTITVRASPEKLWAPISEIGGDRGWYFANWLWDIRGFIDRLAGGFGTRRGRRHPSDLRIGDALDWWRVLHADPGKRLFLVAEMKAPGEATLEFRLKQNENGTSELVQIASFMPRGVAGLAYWYLVSPFHFFIFKGMLKGIAKAAGAEIVHGPEEIKPPDHKKNR